MPGLSARAQQMYALLTDPSSKLTAEQRAALTFQLQQESEGWFQPREVSGGGFSGSATGEVLDAPWRGEYDMPGNFERRQKTANSMAEDAMLNAGRKHAYGWKPGQLLEAQWQKVSPAMAANAPGYARDQTEKFYYTGPPDYASMREHMFDPMQWDPSGKRPMTESDLQQIARMVDAGMGDAARRLYRGRAGFDQMFGGE